MVLRKKLSSGFISVMIFKQTIDVHLQSLTNSINYALQESTFPNKLK